MDIVGDRWPVGVHHVAPGTETLAPSAACPAAIARGGAYTINVFSRDTEYRRTGRDDLFEMPAPTPTG